MLLQGLNLMTDDDQKQYGVDNYYYDEENTKNGHYYGKGFEKPEAAAGIARVELKKLMMTRDDLYESLWKLGMILMFEKGRCGWVLSGIGMSAVINYFVIISLLISCMMNSADYDWPSSTILQKGQDYKIWLSTFNNFSNFPIY